MGKDYDANAFKIFGDGFSMLALKDKRVAILMATYQGECFIHDQLSSIFSQSFKNWDLYISDDNSSDKTIDVIKSFSLETGVPVNICSGPCKGFVSNFMSLLSKDKIESDYFAFSDQDDVWHNNKLERAINWLDKIPTSKPALYCTRTHLVDINCKSIGYSPLFKKKPSFHNALIQSIGGGNTMVINKAARDLIVQAGNVDVISHDWWIYILISGAGGEVFHDIEPTMDYRQHPSNIIGSNLGIKAKFIRLTKIFEGQYKHWNELHIIALEKNIDLLSPDNRRKLVLFKKIHSSSFFERMVAYFRLRLYRQSRIDDLGIFVSAIFNKL
ncbi:glycosyltransferase family 2 protein [Pantoea agglomerans]|uniref:glycosyltransferase family 2 protein n=1 Tax=Enterobacter agglomerans TaxID=549 RepID=UPI003965C004